MKKNLFGVYLFVSLLTSSMAYGAMPLCNYSTKSESVYDLMGDETYKVSPKANCDAVYTVNTNQPLRDCMNALDNKGYSCVQVTTWTKSWQLGLPDTSNKICYGCL